MKKKKIIVTHIFPDLDAITSVWLLRRFDSRLGGVEVKFVPAGTTWEKQAVDSDPDIIHVDTGGGRFDHHQTEEKICAAGLVFEYLKNSNEMTLKYQSAVERLVKLVLAIDHFDDCFWEDADSDKYDLCVHHLIDHLKISGRLNDRELVSQGELLLEAILFGFYQKIKVEEEIKKGVEFQTIWGRSLGMETKLSRVSKMAQKKGYDLVARKEPGSGFVSIKCQPRKDLDLTKAYQALKEADNKADWFFHKSKHIILNGSRHNQEVKPSSLELTEVIQILKKII